MEEIEKLLELTEKTEENIKQIGDYVEKLREYYSREILKLKETKGLNIDEEKLREFFKEFWYVYPSKNPNEWFIAIPKFINFSVGWFDHQTTGYNVYLINRYTQWLGELPSWLKEELKLEEPLPLFVEDGTLMFPKEKREEIRKRYGELLDVIEEDKGRIKVGKEFDLIARIIESGGLPFVPKPVAQSDLREPQVNFDLSGKYSFQKEAYEKFLKFGAVGVYWMCGAGKSFLAIYILDSLKGRKVVFVPNNTLKEQWKEYFRKYAPRLLDEVEVYHYSRWKDVKDKEYIIAVFDENQFLPADTYAKLSTLKTKYRLGLSASPFREDQRTNYIFALTGYPLGLGWKDLMKILGKHYHEVNVFVVKNLNDKFSKVRGLFNPERKTFIFSFRLDIGQKLASMLGIPFVSGQTKDKDRVEILLNNKAVVISKVAELGVSVKDLEHIIEVDFLYGSRQEELQLTGRILHGSNPKAKHDILMTKEEFLKYGKRLHSLIEKGFYPKVFYQTDIYEEEKITEKKEVKKFW